LAPRNMSSRTRSSSGSGAGGAAVARRLVESGQSVVMVEMSRVEQEVHERRVGVGEQPVDLLPGLHTGPQVVVVTDRPQGDQAGVR
jgi:hypothetical protein